MRILALDVGDSRIGVAISDPTEMLATPLNIIKRLNEASDIQIILATATERGVGKIVVGLPLALSGGEGAQAEKVRDFVTKLREDISIPLEMVDERFSTVAAREYMRETGKKKNRFRKHDDAVAAAVILQGYLDENRQHHG